jgi:hypothetical protein
VFRRKSQGAGQWLRIHRKFVWHRNTLPDHATDLRARFRFAVVVGLMQLARRHTAE